MQEPCRGMKLLVTFTYEYYLPAVNQRDSPSIFLEAEEAARQAIAYGDLTPAFEEVECE